MKKPNKNDIAYTEPTGFLSAKARKIYDDEVKKRKAKKKKSK